MRPEHHTCATIVVISSILLYNQWAMKRYIRQILKRERPTIRSRHLCSSVQRTIKQEINTSTDDYIRIKHFNDNIEAFEGRNASDWVYDKTIVSVNENDPVKYTLDLMHSNKASCALVYNVSHKLSGVLDLLDVARSILLGVFDQLLPVGQLLRTCAIAQNNATLNDVCRQLKAGARYIAIENDESESHQIISQRAIAQSLYEISSYNNNLRKALAVKVGSMLKPVKTCPMSGNAREAFEMMAMYGITSLPICNTTGQAIGVISATDILFCRNDLHMLDKAVLDYVALSREHANIRRSAREVVMCEATHTLGDALQKMLENRIHHIYVLNELEPISVISFIDILRHV